MPHDPHGPALPALLALLVALVAMARVTCVDVRRLEIDPAWTALAACAGLAAAVAVDGPATVPGAGAAAAASGGAAWLAARLRAGAVGRGDIGLFAAVGLAAGPDLLPPVLCLAVAFSLVTAVAYGLARGKSRRRLAAHMFPAALPCMAALAPALAWRTVSGVTPLAAGPAGAATVALAGSLALACGLLAGALPMAVRRQGRAARVAATSGPASGSTSTGIEER